MGLWVYGSIGLWVYESIELLKHRVIDLLTHRPIDLLTYRPIDLFRVLCLVSCVLCFVPSSHADLDMHILAGFDAYHKHGRWLPLRITLASVDEDIDGEVAMETQDSTTGLRQTYLVPAVLSRATRKVQYLYVLPESFRRNLRVRLMDNYEKEVLRKDVALVNISPQDLLIVLLARNGGGLEFLVEHSQAGMPVPQLEQGQSESGKAGKQERKVYISYLTSDLLPDKWKGYDSVDMIMLGDISAAVLSADQRRAITDWVYGGGRLLVSGGAHSQDLVGTFVEKLLPVKMTGTRVLDSIPSSLSKLAARSTSRQSGVNTGGARMVIASSELTDRGRIIAAEDDGLPIIAEKKAGDGSVIFLAFDYLDPALRAWGGRKEMWESLLPQSTIRKYPEDRDIARLLPAFRLSGFPALWLSGLFLLLYILCFGPLNYLILKRFNSGKWMWVTMPAVAAAFTIGSLGFAYATRSRAAVVNDLSVVDVYNDIGRARIISYFGLFSAAKPDYRIAFPASEAMFVNRIWSPDREGRQDGDCRLVERDIFQMEILRIKTLSPQLLCGESYINLSGSVSINLSEGPDGVIHGEASSDLPFDLTDCYVFSNGHYAYIGDLTRGIHAVGTRHVVSSGNTGGTYSTRDAEKQRFINAVRSSLSHRVSGTGLIGWMNESVLRTLIEMDMGEDYKSLGMALVIVHL